MAETVWCFGHAGGRPCPQRWPCARCGASIHLWHVVGEEAEQSDYYSGRAAHYCDACAARCKTTAWRRVFPQISNRLSHMLYRGGIAPDELATTADEALLAIRMFGVKSLREARALVPAIVQTCPTCGGTGRVASVEQAADGEAAHE